jgi:hypothetical protein
MSMFTEAETAEFERYLAEQVAPMLVPHIEHAVKTFIERAGRVEKLRTFMTLLPAGGLRANGDFVVTQRLMRRVATDLGYWPLTGKSISELYGIACADLERELYGDAVPPPAKGDTWE